MKIGYARVSTIDQSLDSQLDKLKEAGCEIIYQEKISGIKKERPELYKLLDYVREGDTIIVTELTRISRGTRDLFSIVEHIEGLGVNIKSIRELWLDTTTPHGKLMFTVIAGISQFERDIISVRTREGLKAARARGRKGGRKPKDPKIVNIALKMYADKNYTIPEIVRATKLSKTSLYRYLKSQKPAPHKVENGPGVN